MKALIYDIVYKFLLWVNSNIYRARMGNQVLEKLLLFSFLSDILNSNPFLIWMGTSQCPLSKHVFPLCERTNHQLIRSIRSDLETNVLKGRTPWDSQPYPASNRYETSHFTLTLICQILLYMCIILYQYKHKYILCVHLLSFNLVMDAAASHESQNRRDIICKNEFFVLFLFLVTR